MAITRINHSPETIAKALRLLDAKWPVARVARVMKVDPRVIRDWRDKRGRQARPTQPVDRFLMRRVAA